MIGRRIRTHLRDSGLRLIRLAGGFDAASGSRWRSRRLLILCYHGFAQRDEHLWNPSLYVTREHLEQRLEFLAADGYVVLPLGEGLARLTDGTLPPRAVAITVDDGTYDFYSVGYPVFKRFGVPVTVYVATYYVFHRRPVFDGACQYFFWRAGVSGKLDVKDPRGGRELSLRTPADRARAFARVQEVAVREEWSADAKHEWLAHLAHAVGLDWQPFLDSRLLTLMCPDEVGALDPAIADIQLHTHRHRVPEEKELFLRELRENRQALAECGLDPRRLTHFCYPSGVHRLAFLPWLAEAGIRSAVTTVPGLASSGQDRLLLPRFIDTGTTSNVEFEGWASGLRHFLGRPGLGFAL